MRKSIWILSILILAFNLAYVSSSWAGMISFGPQETTIIGSIPYSVIGLYKANFKQFEGKITLDENQENIKSVNLNISSDSITSNCSWCDTIVKSSNLLNIQRYPSIDFKSESIIHDDQGFKVKGILEMHGIKHEMSFPFQVQISSGHLLNQKVLDIKGRWEINRKEFNIIWNRILDQGGILVGNYITVQWGIRAVIKS